MCDVIYLVKVGQGSCDDYHEHEIFATIDKELADEWVIKFNRILDENLERIKCYYDDDNWDKAPLFLHDDIAYDTPNALISKVKLR